MPAISKLRRLSSTKTGRERIRAALVAAGGIVPHAAKSLGVPASTLHEALRRYLSEFAALAVKLPVGRRPGSASATGEKKDSKSS